VSGDQRHGSGLIFRTRHDHAYTDLNGDGDTDDDVMHVFDARAGSVVSLGTQGEGGQAFIKGRLYFTTEEYEQGIDLKTRHVDLAGATMNRARRSWPRWYVTCSMSSMAS